MNQQRMIADRYEIGEPIGWGGMGEVFRGRDIVTNQPVAIKSLRDGVIAQDPHIVKRFEREGQALQQLQHLNIVRVISTVTIQGKHYIVMEYMAGGSLADLIATQPQLPLARVCTIARDLANALECAHSQRIFHRDIKPSNVLLAEDGTTRLSDFGIAHISGLTSLTQAGTMIGTYLYLSPEAWYGAAPDQRTDIWAFGVLLFELIAGRRPFEGSQPEVLRAILEQPVPDLMQLCPDTPPALCNLIHSMLEKDPDKRLSNVQLVHSALEQLGFDDRSDSASAAPKAPAAAPPQPADPQQAPTAGRGAMIGATRARATMSGRAFQEEHAPITRLLDFDIVIEAASNLFTVRVQAQDDRGAIELKTRSFTLPFDLKNLSHQRKNAADWVKLARIIRRRGSEELRNAREFGEQLFGHIFAGEVLATFRTCRADLNPGDHMRLRLRLPEQLASLPWELLYDSEEQQFLVLDHDLSLVRYPRVYRPIKPLHVNGPLHILAVLASPNDPNYPALRLDHELRRIEAALQTSRLHHQIVFDIIRGPNTLLQLRDRLRHPVHVLHILSHGDLDEDNGEGVLIFEDAEGAAMAVNAELLRLQLQRQHGQTHLVLLNACLGALPAASDPFSSLGVALLQGGVPAVMAMQFELADDAAAELAQIFYAELAQGAPIDLALREARLHLYASYRNRLDWAVPVLFLRAEGGILFDDQRPVDTNQDAGDDPATMNRAQQEMQRAARAAIKEAEERGDWTAAVSLLEHYCQQAPDDAPFKERLKTAQIERTRLAIRQAEAFAEQAAWEKLLKILEPFPAQDNARIAALLAQAHAALQAPASGEQRSDTKEAPQPTTLPGSQHQAESVLLELDFLQKLAKEKRRRVNIRQLQIAKLGISADPALIIEVEDIESEIHDLEHQMLEIRSRLGERTGQQEHESQPLQLLKHRRIDAAITGQAKVGQQIDLITQIRFPNSPPLSSKEAPTKKNPISVEQIHESASLKFEINRETKTLESLYLNIRIIAPDFVIEGDSRQRVEVPPGDYSPRVAFLLTPTKPGKCRIHIEVYTIENSYLGTIPVETTVGRVASEPTTNIANLLFNVAVESEQEVLRASEKGQQHSDLVASYIEAANIPKALELIEATLQQQPTDREMIIWLSQLIENPIASSKQRLQAAQLATRYVDTRPGVCSLPPAMAALADSRIEIARYPITTAQFQCFIEDGGYNPQQSWWRNAGKQWLLEVEITEPEFWKDELFGQSRSNHPVVGVSWFEAEAFCSWLTQSRRFNAEGFVYRLPTEAEWQRAAQAGEHRDYPWGAEKPSTELTNFDKQIGSTTPVGCFVAGATPITRIYDLAGNVYEWTSSIYERISSPQAESRSTASPLPERSFGVCGGSWRTSHALLHIHNRHHYSPDYTSTSLGFRVVRTPAPTT